jgi:hypothetical protein
VLSIALQGIGLFLFIPLVLVLFLRQPVGAGLSVALGLVLMVGHRFLAGPWARRHAAVRCAWCAGDARAGVPLVVDAGRVSWNLRACSESHRALASRFFSLLRRWRMAIAAGIFVPLALLVGGTLARAAGHPVIPHVINTLQFRLIVAFTVVGASLGYRWIRRPDERLACPFPLHNFLLLGIRQTLWIFRIVGAWWIVDGVRRIFG